jgi:hypothetical protein
VYDPLHDIVFAIVAVAFCAWWWFIAKNTASRKYIILLGICWLVASIDHIIGKSFDIPTLRGVLGGVGVLALLGSICFLIKAILLERKAKKKSPD